MAANARKVFETSCISYHTSSRAGSLQVLQTRAFVALVEHGRNAKTRIRISGSVKALCMSLNLLIFSEQYLLECPKECLTHRVSRDSKGLSAQGWKTTSRWSRTRTCTSRVTCAKFCTLGDVRRKKRTPLWPSNWSSRRESVKTKFSIASGNM